MNDVRDPLTTITSKAEHLLVAPFLAGVGGRAGQSPERSPGRPYQTITAKADAALVCPTLIQIGYGERDGQAPRVPGLDKPLGTAVAGGQKHALVAAFLSSYHASKSEGDHRCRPADEPVGTQTTENRFGLVASHLLKLHGSSRDGQPLDRPMATIRAQGTHIDEVRAFLMQYNGRSIGAGLDEPFRTNTSKDRFALVTVHGEDYVIADIGLRMLTPRELYRAQGFRDSYRIDLEVDGRPLSKTAQVRMVGNSVSPPVAAAVARAQFTAVEERVTA